MDLPVLTRGKAMRTISTATRPPVKSGCGSGKKRKKKKGKG